MSEYVIRFLVGGIVVSAFSMLGDVLKPKSFAGLFRGGAFGRTCDAWNRDLRAWC
ncbi:hypothetical protein ABIF64_000110 [Bradyrhizobium japonicum]